MIPVWHYIMRHSAGGGKEKETYISKVSFKGAYFWASDSQMGARRLQWPHLRKKLASPLNKDRK